MIFRDAVKDDLPAILALLVDDVLGRARDTGVVDARYEQAFAAVVESSAMMRWIIDGARREGVSSVQLISHTSREDAHRFYERLGFAASHVGMRLQL